MMRINALLCLWVLLIGIDYGFALAPQAITTRKTTAPLDIILWSDRLPSKEISFSGNAISLAEAYQEQQNQYKGPQITLFRSMNPDLFERFTKEGFEPVPREAAIGRAERREADYWDDVIVHNGRLPFSGMPIVSIMYGSEHGYNVYGRMIAITLPIELLFEKEILLLPDDAFGYYQRFFFSYDFKPSLIKSGKVSSKEILDPNYPRTRALNDYLIKEVSDPIKTLLEQAVKQGEHDEVKKLVRNMAEIIIPAHLLYPFLREAREISYGDRGFFTLYMRAPISYRRYSFLEKLDKLYSKAIPVLKNISLPTEKLYAERAKFKLLIDTFQHNEDQILDVIFSQGLLDFIIDIEEKGEIGWITEKGEKYSARRAEASSSILTVQVSKDGQELIEITYAPEHITVGPRYNYGVRGQIVFRIDKFSVPKASPLRLEPDVARFREILYQIDRLMSEEYHLLGKGRNLYDKFPLPDPEEAEAKIQFLQSESNLAHSL